MSGRSSTQTISIRVSSGRSGVTSSSASDRTIEKGRTTKAKGIDIGVAKDIIKTMASKYSAVRVNDLSGDAKRDFDLLNEMFRLSTGTQVYATLVEYTKSSFGGIGGIQIGTVGAHFYGWFAQSSSSIGVPLECSPLTSGSIRPPGSEKVVCKSAVGVYENGKLTLTKSSTSDGTVLVELTDPSDTFSGFTEKQVTMLKKNGVDTATITCSGKTVYSRTSVDEITDKSSLTGVSPSRTYSDKTKIYDSDSSSEEDCDEDDEGSSTSVIVFIVCVLVVVAIAVAVSWWWRSRATSQAKAGSYDGNHTSSSHMDGGHTDYYSGSVELTDGPSFFVGPVH